MSLISKSILYTKTERIYTWFYIIYEDMVCEGRIDCIDDWDDVKKLWSIFEEKYQIPGGLSMYSDNLAGSRKQIDVQLPLFRHGESSQNPTRFQDVITYCENEGLSIHGSIRVYKYKEM